jgi:serralysin
MADDYAASVATTGTVAIGGSVTGSIETTGDVDWIRVTLTAGTTYRFDLEGSDTGQGTLQSPRLQLLDGSGILLLSDLDSGGYGGPGQGYSSQLSFTAASTGTYYLTSAALGNQIGILGLLLSWARL